MNEKVSSKHQLQQELKKRQPFDMPEQEAMLNLLRTNDQFQNRFGRLFRQFGLTSSQYNVLRILRGEGQPMPCQEIAERMVQVVPAMTGLLDRLEKLDFVQRQRSDDDRRVIHVKLTPAGQRVLKQLDRPVLDLHKQLMGHFSSKELQELSRLLVKARQTLSENAQ